MDGAHHWVSVTTVLVADGTSSHTRPVVGVGSPAPPGVEPSIPFRVVRSRFGNLPVYLDYKSGGSRVLTIVRKVEGDAVVSGVCGLPYDCVPQHSLKALEKMLRAHLDVKGLLTRADNLIGSVTISGNHKDRTVAWLKAMGF